MNKDEERKRIGRRIAEVRKSVEWMDGQGIRRKGMTQAELAERCEIAQSHITRIERGMYNFGFDTLQQIAEAVGMKLDFVKD